MIQAAPLQQQMRPFVMGREASSAIEQNYFRFYGLDFEHQMDGVHHDFGFMDSNGYRLACHLFHQTKAKGTWLVHHGYYDHTGMIPHSIRFFLEQGYNVLAYDLPGHGLSTGSPATIADFSIYTRILEEVIQYTEGWLTHPCHLFGHSTGCAIITDFLHARTKQSQSLFFEKVVLSAPLVRPYRWRIGRLQLYILRLFVKQIPRTFTKNSRDDTFLKKVRNDPLTPRILPTEWVSALDRWIQAIEATSVQIPVAPLILQGTDDTTVDARHNIPLLENLYQQPKVCWLEDARHHLPNELSETRDEFSRWLIKHL